METKKTKGREAGPGNITRYPTPVGEVAYINAMESEKTVCAETCMVQDDHL